MPDVSVSFGADTGDLQDGIKQAAAQIDSFGSTVYSALDDANGKMKSVGTSFKNLAADAAAAIARIASGGGLMTVAGGVLALGAAVGGTIGVVTEQAVKLGESLDTASAQLGTTTQNVATLVPVAAAAGMSLGDLTKKFTDLREKLRTGDDDVQNALKALKIDPGSFKTQDAAQQMATLNEAVSSLADSYTKNVALEKLFGDSATQLLPVLDRGTASFQNLTGAVQRTGIALSRDMLDDLRGTMSIVTQVTDNFHEVTLAAQGLAATSYGQLKPAIDMILTSFAGSVKSSADFTENLNKATQKGEGLTPVLTALKDTVVNVAVAIGTFNLEIQDSFKDLTNWSVVLDRAADLVGDFWTSVTSHKTVKDMTGGGAEDFQKFADAVKVTMNQTTEGIEAKALTVRKQIEAVMAKPIKVPPIQGPTAGTMPGADDNKVDRDAVRAQMESIQGQIKVLQEGLAQKKVIFDAEAAQFRITQAQKIAALEAETQKEYEAELALLQKELTIPGMKQAQTQQVNNKILELQTKHNTDMLQLDNQAIAAAQKQWQGYFDAIEGAFNSQLKGLLAGTTSWKQAMGSILNDLLVKFIEMVEKMSFEWLAGQLSQTATTTTQVAARTAAQAAGATATATANAASIIASIRASAAEAFAGVAGFLAPVMGPAAVGPAAATEATVMAAAAGVGLPTFAAGAWKLPTDMIAQVHQGETILPAGLASTFRTAMTNAASGGGASGGSGDVHLHLSVSAIDASSFASYVNNPTVLRSLANGLARQLNLNPSLRPAY